MKQHRTRDTWQILCVCAALHGCTSNRSPSPQDLSGTVIQGAGDNGEAGNASGTHADAGVGNAATGNGNMPPDMTTGSGTGGSPANTGSGGQPAMNSSTGGSPANTGSGGSATTPPVTFDAGVGEPDDDDDDAPDAATDAGVDAGFGDDDDEYERP